MEDLGALLELLGALGDVVVGLFEAFVRNRQPPQS